MDKTTPSKTEIDQAIKALKVNGISLIKSYMAKSSELEDLKKKIHQLVCIKAKQYDLDLPSRSQNAIHNTIIKLNFILFI